MDLLKELDTYILSHPHERETAELFTGFLGKNIPLTIPQAAGHVTASAWIINYDRTRVLLTHHARLDRWFQLGGHREEGEDILDASMREAREESGLESLQVLDRRIFDIDAHLIPAGSGRPEHFHYDIRFLFQADSEEPLKISSESRELRWVTPEEAKKLNSGESIGRMIEKCGNLAPSVFGIREPGVTYIPRQGAYGLLVNGRNELALVRITNPPEFFLPGGGIEAGEDHSLCLEREFEEETGLEVSVKDFLGTSVQYVHAHRAGRYYKIIGHMYRCELNGRKGKKVEDDHELSWIPLERTHEIMAMDNQKWAVRALMKILTQSSQS